jgi:hypothetical protein
VPSSLKAGPFTSLVLVKKRYLFFHVFLIWITIFVIQFEFWLYWVLLYQKIVHFIAYLPFVIFGMYLSAVFVSLIAAKLLLLVVNVIHKPQEGTFLRYPSDKDYRYWSIRNTIKRWPIWLSHKFPIPFLDNICLKWFGVKTKFKNSLFEGWIDTELMDFGDNVVVGQGSIVQSSVIIGDFLIIQRTIIEDNCKIGAHSVIMPGTHMGKNSILAATSTTIVGQELEEGYVFFGVPAKKYKKNVFLEDNLEEIIESQFEDVEHLRKTVDEFITKRHDKPL